MNKVTPPDPMNSTHRCEGNCDRVPDQVSDAIVDTLTILPAADNTPDARDHRAIALAQRMAAEGWRFCPCFSEGTTHQHARIFGLVHTKLANKLAQKAEREAAYASDKQSAA